MTMSRSTVVLVLVIVTAVAIGAVVAVQTGSGSATAMGAYGGQNVAAGGLADTSSATASIDTPTGVDPAKQEPVLNLFHSKNPFAQVTSAPSTGGGTTEGTANPTPAPSSTSEPHAADVAMKPAGGSTYATYTNRVVGDKLPPAKPVIQVQQITASGVSFTLLNGYTVEGASEFTASVGDVVQLNLTKSTGSGSKTTVVYIKVLQIIFKTSGGSGGSGSGGSGSGGSGSGGSTSSGYSSTGSPSSGSATVSAHTIKVLSIDSKNGAASATIVVDGVTYANKQVGDTFVTKWGQIKVVGINAPGQTVTLLHADVRVTVHVGQSYSK